MRLFIFWEAGIVELDDLKSFVKPYYANKDIMHNMWHIELVHKWVDKIIKLGNYNIDYEKLIYAMFFHGFIYSNGNDIKHWLKMRSFSNDKIEDIIKITWESQRNEVPTTVEGKILHDAHILEGGRTYLVAKTLIAGSVRGQSLLETINYMKQNVIDKNRCYLPETYSLCDEMNEYAKKFIEELEEDIA